ncbi:pyocin knob domain-containing protein [Paenibacillus sp. L3-i20]|uniref:pyocin knob domain-containing protein n=1 Tax=Paenibacillus sp. L3-i20 TaxID=2905833 RepID=UPI001EDE1270|nr:pyocin knob domain-containing protein [Paenibacillus sp. L3-i20]GKU79846.1 hypothetical protein L3i20_v242430 [Paenibacillus sp. L3-i20]
MAKTNWALDDTVLPTDLNQIGTEINTAIKNAGEANSAVAGVSTQLTTHMNDTTGAHGATSEAIPGTLAERTADGWLAGVGFASSAPQGTAPFWTQSTTLVERFNSEFFNGLRSSDFYRYGGNTGVTNADTHIGNGFYCTPDTFVGSPFPGQNGSNQGYLEHISWFGRTDYALQRHTPINANISNRYRIKNNGKWQPWVTTWDSSNDGANSGLDADKLHGMPPSWVQDADSIVARDSKGDITARQYVSVVGTGTAPLKVYSTTPVQYLNVDLLDSKHASDFDLRTNGSTTDFNAALTHGKYGFASVVANSWRGGMLYGVLEVIVSDFGIHNNRDNWIWQKAYTTDSETFIRNKVNSSPWTAWQPIWTGINSDFATNADVGNKASLATSNKTNLVAAINEVFTSASDGKAEVAAVITGREVPTAANASYTVMANNIKKIPAIRAGAMWELRSTPELDLNSVCYGNGLFVAFSTEQTSTNFMTSTDGINWTLRTSHFGWWTPFYANGLFVAVTSNATAGYRAMTSPDGINWTLRATPADIGWGSIAYGNGIYVAVSDSGVGNRVMTSPNGINWTLRAAPINNDWNSVVFGNGIFVAVASSGTGNRVMTSSDGISWTSRTSAADNGWLSVCYGDGLFVAVSFTGTGNRVMTSPNGINWTIRTSASNINWYSVAYGAGMFAAVGTTGTGTRVMTSYDGITWTMRTGNATGYWRSVCFGNDKFVAVAGNGDGTVANNRVMTSSTHM